MENSSNKSIVVKTKEITEVMVQEYLAIADVMKNLEKKKEELRASILYAYPNGGYIGEYKVDVKEEAGRRSFKFDDAKAAVEFDTWNKVFIPFIKIGETIRKLIITKV